MTDLLSQDIERLAECTVAHTVPRAHCPLALLKTAPDQNNPASPIAAHNGCKALDRGNLQQNVICKNNLCLRDVYLFYTSEKASRWHQDHTVQCITISNDVFGNAVQLIKIGCVNNMCLGTIRGGRFSRLITEDTTMYVLAIAEKTGNEWLCTLFRTDKKHIAQSDGTIKLVNLRRSH